MKNSIIGLFSLCLIAGINLKGYTQEALKPRPSPMYVATMKYEEAYIKVTYCRPHKKGREIFGGLVPFGIVWRTGANEATEITFTKEVQFGGNTLRAGTYTIFSIPSEKSWIVILNSELGQWGAYRYEEAKDVLRVEASVRKADSSYEPFTIEFKQNDEGADLVMMWDMTMVSIPIVF